MFNFRRKHHRHQHGNCECHKDIPAGCIPLSEAPEKKRIIVQANSDIKTMEMGLYPGSILTIMHNDPGERNIIVKIHDQRYVIPRDITDQIFVKI